MLKRNANADATGAVTANASRLRVRTRGLFGSFDGGVACKQQRELVGAQRDESGAEVVELAIILPVLTLLLAGTIDLGLVGQNAGQCETVAVEAARYMTVHPETADASALKAVLEELYPGLAFDSDQVTAGYKLDVTLERGSVESTRYNHHFALTDGTYDTRSSIVTTQPVTVTVSLTRPYFTPVGTSWSTAAGGSGVTTATASAVTRVDATTAGSW